MRGDETLEGERRETVGELIEFLVIIQKMGQRLAYETHGESYDLVYELNELLHQTREKLELIQRTAQKAD
jgi:hypothetical protein